MAAMHGEASPTPFGQPSASRPPKVVVGNDGSDSASRALERAAAFAGPQTQIVAVAVVEPYPGSGVTIPVNESEAEVRRPQVDLVEARAKRWIRSRP